MKSLMSLFQPMLADASIWCRASTIRDWKTITDRVKHEGLSFLTITLPTFSTGFEMSLSQGKVDPTLFTSFKRRRDRSLPEFLQGLTGRVFDSATGLLLDEPCVVSIYFVRQLCLLAKKILLPCSLERERKAYAGYIKSERDLSRWMDTVQQNDISHFGRVSDMVWGTCLSHVDHLVYTGSAIPNHGPGATADRLRGNSKYDQRIWHRRLEEGNFPSADFMIPNYGFYESLESVVISEPEAELPVKVMTVPKTLKTPRIIAIEPTCMQYAQQSLLSIIVDTLEKDDILGKCIGFTDQVPNQELAQIASIDGSFATIDLSEASDRVSNLLVRRICKNFPHLDTAVQACRSLKADVPGHGVIPLTKFASMGSALCFPFEAMVFLTIIFIGIEKVLNRPLTKSDIYTLSRRVRVYGDDIIVPIEYASSVLNSLEDFCLIVNRRKTFVTGKFRESCGADYFDGHDVRPTYMRRTLPLDRSNAQEIISTIEFRNQLYKAGLWLTCGYVDDIVRGLAPFPIVGENSPALGRRSFLPGKPQKMCPHLQRPLVKALVVSTKAPTSVLTGVGALMKFFLKKGSDPFFDKKHLERYGRPRSVDIKIAWAPLH